MHRTPQIAGDVRERVTRCSGGQGVASSNLAVPTQVIPEGVGPVNLVGGVAGLSSCSFRRGCRCARSGRRGPGSRGARPRCGRRALTLCHRRQRVQAVGGGTSGVGWCGSPGRCGVWASVFSRFRVRCRRGQAGVRLPVIPSPATKWWGAWSWFGRDWLGSIRGATTPPSAGAGGGGQTCSDLAPDHVRARSRCRRAAGWAGVQGAHAGRACRARTQIPHPGRPLVRPLIPAKTTAANSSGCARTIASPRSSIPGLKHDRPDQTSDTPT